MARPRSVWKKAELELAHKEDPEARAEIKRLGLAVGKLVRYRAVTGAMNNRRFGIDHTGVVSALHHKSVEIVMTGDLLGKRWADTILRKDTVPFVDVIEVLGDGRLPESPPPEPKTYPLPPPRQKGYEECDLGSCTKRPVVAYLMRKFDKETMMLGPPRIIAVCKDHDEKYEQAECQLRHDHKKNEGASCVCTVPAHIPLLWQLGVATESWRIPQPEGETPKPRLPPPKPRKTGDPITSPRTDSPYEGVKGRHPKLCDCSRHMPSKA